MSGGIDRRRFLELSLKAAALAGLPAALPGTGRAESSPAGGPVVLEVIRRALPVTAGLEAGEAGLLLDQQLAGVMGSDEPPLDLWGALFPEDKTAGVKVDVAAKGSLTGLLAHVVAGRIILADVPARNVFVWDRTSPAALLPPSAREGARVVSVVEAGGYGGRSRPAGGGPAPALAVLAARIERQATVSALSATSDGRMGPFILESLARGATAWKGEPPTGAAVARIAADPTLLGRTVLHVADLWRVPLGRGADGSERIWDGGTLLIGRDAVALTRVAWRILRNTRRAFGLGETPEPASLAEAVRLGLGEGDLARIRWSKSVF